MSFADFVQVKDLVVGLIRTEGHLLGIVHAVDGPVIKFLVATCLLKIGRLANHELAHLVNEKSLAAREQSQDSNRLCALPLNELS